MSYGVEVSSPRRFRLVQSTPFQMSLPLDHPENRHLRLRFVVALGHVMPSAGAMPHPAPVAGHRPVRQDFAGSSCVASSSGAVQAGHPWARLPSPPTLALPRNHACLYRVGDRPRCESRSRRADTTPEPLLDVRRSAQALRPCSQEYGLALRRDVHSRGFFIVFWFTHRCLRGKSWSG